MDVNGGIAELSSCAQRDVAVGFPAAASPKDRSCTAPRLKANTTRTADHAGSLRVLVIEDNLDTAESLARQLHQWGHQCRICTTGQEALSVMLGYHPQVVLIDIGLPDIDGWRLAHLIPQVSEDRPVLIAVTAYGEEGDFARSQRAEISYHLVKPAYQPQLRQILGRIASR